MKKIQWLPIKGYENLYEVSNYGEVRSIKNNIILAANVKRNGYRRVSLCKDGKVKEMNVHRLVAMAFIPNFENKPTVNHKDFNRINNHVDNLEWATMEEQVQHNIKNKPNYAENLKLTFKEKLQDENFKNKRLAGLKNCDRSKQIAYAKSKTGLKNNRAKLMMHLETGFYIGLVKDLANLYNVTHTAIVNAIKRKGHFKGYFQI